MTGHTVIMIKVVAEPRCVGSVGYHRAPLCHPVITMEAVNSLRFVGQKLSRADDEYY